MPLPRVRSAEVVYAPGAATPPGTVFRVRLRRKTDFPGYLPGTLRLTLTTFEPASSFLRWALRAADGDPANGKFFSGGNWVNVTTPITEGMTTAQINALVGADWERPGGFDPASPFHQLVGFLATTAAAVSPEVRHLRYQYDQGAPAFPANNWYRVRLAARTDYTNFLSFPLLAAEPTGLLGSDFRFAFKFSAGGPDRAFLAGAWAAVGADPGTTAMTLAQLLAMADANWQSAGGFVLGTPYVEPVVYLRTNDSTAGTSISRYALRYLQDLFGGEPTTPDHALVENDGLIQIEMPERQADKVVTEVLVRGRSGDSVRVAGAPIVLATDRFDLNPGQNLRRNIVIPEAIDDASLVHEVRVFETAAYGYLEFAGFSCTNTGGNGIEGRFDFTSPGGAPFNALRGPAAGDSGAPQYISPFPIMFNVSGFVPGSAGGVAEVIGIYADGVTRQERFFAPGFDTSFNFGNVNFDRQVGGRLVPLRAAFVHIGGNPGAFKDFRFDRFGAVPLTEREQREFTDTGGPTLVRVTITNPGGPCQVGNALNFTTGAPVGPGNVTAAKVEPDTTSILYVADVASTWVTDPVQVEVSPRGKPVSAAKPQVISFARRTPGSSARFGVRQLLFEDESVETTGEAEAIAESILRAGESAPVVWKFVSIMRPHAEAGDSVRVGLVDEGKIAQVGAASSPMLRAASLTFEGDRGDDGVALTTEWTCTPYRQAALVAFQSQAAGALKERADVESLYLSSLLLCRVVKVTAGTVGPTDGNLYDLVLVTESQGVTIKGVPNMTTIPFTVGETGLLQYHRGDRQRPFLSGRPHLVNVQPGDQVLPGGTPPPVSTALTLLPTSLPDATVGVAYRQTLTASGGLGTAFTWEGPTVPPGTIATYGTIPPGLALNANGSRTAFLGGAAYASFGTPTTAGTYDFALRVRDDLGNVDLHDYRITVV